MAGREIPERIEFAIELVDPKPGDSILEAGGGPGVAAELVCEAIAPGGWMTMIDRSSVAIRRASKRNATALKNRRLSIEQGELAEVSGGLFDAFFCIDLNTFWTGDGAAEIAAIQRSLRPGGRAIIAYGIGPAGPHSDERLFPIATSLESAGYVDVTVVRDGRGAAITAIRE